MRVEDMLEVSDASFLLLGVISQRRISLLLLSRKWATRNSTMCIVFLHSPIHPCNGARAKNVGQDSVWPFCQQMFFFALMQLPQTDALVGQGAVQASFSGDRQTCAFNACFQDNFHEYKNYNTCK